MSILFLSSGMTANGLQSFLFLGVLRDTAMLQSYFFFSEDSFYPLYYHAAMIHHYTLVFNPQRACTRGYSSHLVSLSVCLML